MSEVHLIFLPTPYSLKPRTKVPHPNANRYLDPSLYLGQPE
jgi:hypothetical protein